MIRAAQADDARAIAAIYAPHVTGGTATFELEPPDAAAMAARMDAPGRRMPWLVWDAGGTVLGYAYARPYNPRAAYRWTAETTIYLSDAALGRGLGHALYGALIDTLTRQGYANAVALVARPNPASERLHERLGFTPAGTIARAGYKHGRWIDVEHWQRILAVPGDPPAEPRGFSPPTSRSA